jgi:hypothetical protein
MSEQPIQAAEAGPAPERSRLPLLLGLLGVVAALGVGAFLFLGDGDPAGDPAAAPVATSDTAPDAVSAADAGGEETVDLVAALPTVTYDVYLSRDPFDPVVPEPVPTSTSTSDGSDSNSTENGDDADADSDRGTGDDSTDRSGDRDDEGGRSENGTCRGEDEVVCAGKVVTLVEIRRPEGSVPTAIVQVDDAMYEVESGQVFAGSFVVRTIDGSCVSILYGDDGFTLCEGDRVLK